MRKFDYKKLAYKSWDNNILLLCSRIHECKGRQDLFVRQKPVQLDRLIEIARIQSTESSNRIEGIVTTSIRMKQLLGEKTTPKNRDEKEILGYKSYQKYVIPAATEEGPGTLELDIKDVVVVAEKDAVHYFKEVFSKEGVTVEVEEQSSDKENKENAVVDPQGEKTEENVTPAKAKKSAKKSTGTEPEVESSEPVVEGTI